MTIRTRIKKLETRLGPKPAVMPIVVVIPEEGETDDQAVERCRIERGIADDGKFKVMFVKYVTAKDGRPLNG